ncbi:uncharacterized [Tachysurus ichikawai]
MRLDTSLCSIRTPFRGRRTTSCFSRSSASLDSSACCLPVRAEAEGGTCTKPSFSRCHMSHASVTHVTSGSFSGSSGDVLNAAATSRDVRGTKTQERLRESY